MDLHTPTNKTFGFGKLYKVRDAYSIMVNESYQNDQKVRAFHYVVESIKNNDIKRIKKFATKNHKLADIAMTNAINRALTSMKKAFKGMTMTDSMKKSFIKKVRVAINAEIEPATRIGKKQLNTIPSKMKPRKLMTIKESEEDIYDRLSAKEIGLDDENDLEDREFKASNFKLSYFDDNFDLVKKKILSSNVYKFSSPDELRDKIEDTLLKYGEKVEFYVTDDNSEISNTDDFRAYGNDYEGDSPRIRSLDEPHLEDKDVIFVLGYTKTEEIPDEDGYVDGGDVYFIKTTVEAGYGTKLDHDEFKKLTTVSLDEIPASITGKDSPSDDDDNDYDSEPEQEELVDDEEEYEDEDEEDEEIFESDEELLNAFDSGKLDKSLSLNGEIDESKPCKKCKKEFKKIRNH